MISRATGAARGRLGASYIEVLVGVFVMVTLAVAVTGLATVGTKTAFNNKLTTQAQAIANEKSELIRILSYDDVGYLSLQGCVEEDLECEPDGVLSKNEEVLRDSVTYNVNILVQLIDDETNGTLDPDEQKTEDNADYKQVYISVSTPSTETAQSNVQVSLISVRGKSCTTSDSCYGDQVCCDNVCQEPCNPAEIPPGWRCTADLCGVLPPGGDPCNEDLDCLEGWRCDPATNECGGDGDEDEDCELDEDCLASLHCGPGGTCIDDGVNGDPCDASSDCVSGFCDAVTQQCDDGGDNGSPCTGGWDCLSGECDLVSAQCIGDGPGGGGGGEEGVGGSSNCGPPEVNGCYVYVRDDVNGDGLCEVTNIYKSPECSEAWCDTIPDDGQVVSSCGVQDPDYPRAITACDLEMVSNTKCDYDVECIDLYGSNATCQPYDGLPDPSSVACPNGKPDCAGYGADAQCGDPAGLDPGHCYVRGNCYLPGQNNCGACTPQETWTSYDQGVTDPSSFIPFDVSPRISCCYYFDRGTVTSGVPDPPLITEYSTRPCRAPSEPCQVNGQWGTCELSEVNNESTGCSYYKCSVTPPPTATPVGARGVCPGAGNAWSTAASSINIDKDSPSIKITDYYSMEPAVVYSIDTDKYVDELGRNLQVGDMLRFNLDCQVNDDGGVAGTFDLLLPNADSYLFNKIKAWLKAAVPVADAQATGNCGFRIGISNRSDIDNGDFTQLENATSGDPYGKFSYYLQQSDSDKVVVLIVTPASSEQEQVLAGTAEITGNLYININNPNCYLCGCLVDDPLHPLDSIPENLTLTM
ncbi:MAG: hypothetical protein U1C49_00525, partial [Candidatus Andersenbacteria bacterium]|nr:hypothetical protein [Candidatus Andersenbacteria bacterium]